MIKLSLADSKMVTAFVTESNKIEGILRPPTVIELDEHMRFMGLPKITVEELERFVSVYQPGAVLRDKYGLNVQVGNHVPPKGSPEIRGRLETLLHDMHVRHDPWLTHVDYETLHPFTDGNGRSGRAVWAWQMQHYPLGFLHSFYYQTLKHVGHYPTATVTRIK